MCVCVPTGLSAVSSAAGLQYYFVYDRKNFTEAQRYCREKHTDLVTVDSMEVMKILTNTADLDNMFYSNNSYVSSLFSLSSQSLSDRRLETLHSN